MSSSDYYWAQHLIKGFGKMWFLKVPQEADSSGGGESLLGSVVNELRGGLFSSTGLIGKDFPEPNHLSTPQLLLKSIEKHRKDLGIADGELLIQAIDYSRQSTEVEKKSTLKVGIGDFPGIPASFSIDYSRMARITVTFGDNTRLKYIPIDYLGRLKKFFKGDDTKVDPASSISIDKETIIHQILLTDEYSIAFESVEEFDSRVEASVQQANSTNDGKIKFELDQITRKRIVVKVDDGKDYLVALKDIDWDDF
jgi:hypothetical protein